MSGETHENLRRIFELALAARPEDRPAILERECAGDAALCRRIEVMLTAAEDDQFLSAPTGGGGGVGRDSGPEGGTAGAAAAMADPGDAADGLLTEGPGSRIGPYKLLEVIGEGGFGTVFMAEQQEPVIRRVALKIIKLGMDTRQVIARFEAERQALAMMDHPSIARVFDAGATPTGRPYFVMELCKGEAITTFCDRRRLTIRERLELFEQVCNAAQHAHGKGVIHRDIKPFNILVTELDGRPSIKVIDFGIAKATSARLTEKTLFTEHKAFIGTPEYMSPEQAAGSLDIDTRSDIYSLGVLLYELLTGSTPFGDRQLRSAAYAELQRIIREVEPPKPSARLSRNTQNLAGVAERRDTQPRALGTLIRGDLDWIVMKALEKDRQRRYETASGLAMDVRRYLAGAAVSAAPPSAVYVASKFIRRNRGAVLAGGLIAATIVLGGMGAGAGLVWALRERDRADSERAKATLAAEAESAAKLAAQANEQRAVAEAARAEAAQQEEKQARARAEAISSFVTKALLSSDPRAGGKVDATIAQAMNNALKELEGGAFEKDPRTEASLRNTIATILQNNARFGEAETQFLRALALREQALGPEHNDVASVLNNLANFYSSRGQPAKAEAYGERGLAIREKLMGPDHLDVARSLVNLAGVKRNLSRFAEAEPLILRALAIREKALGPDHPDVATVLLVLGGLYSDMGRPEQGLPLMRRALAILERKLSPDHPMVTTNQQNLAVVLSSMDLIDEAQELLARALATREKILGPNHPDVASTLATLGQSYVEHGRSAEGEAMLTRALTIYEKVSGPDHPDLANPLMHLGAVHARAGEAEASRREFDRAIKILRRASPGGSSMMIAVLHESARARVDGGRDTGRPGGAAGAWAGAEPTEVEARAALSELEEATAIGEKLLRPDHPRLLRVRRDRDHCRKILAERAADGRP